MIFNTEVYGDIKTKINELEEDISSVYFLKYNGCISYIGQSVCVKRRLIQHLMAKEKPFNDFSFIETESNLLDSVESFYILFHSPAFNKMHCLMTNTKNSFVSKNGLEKLYKSVDEYYSSENVSIRKYERIEPTQQEIAKYFGYSPTAFQKWREIKDPIRKEKLGKRFEALKEYYINHSKEIG